jgi:lambda family phage minor tail protein L
MSDLFLLKNTEVIDLYEIKINDFEGYFRFHGSKNFNKDLIFKDVVYIYIPSELSSLEYSSEGKQSRPILSISNVNNFIGNFIKDRNDLLGCRFFRKKILAKDLDDVNFGGTDKNTLGSASFSSFISSDTYIIQKKNTEQKDKVDFLLANVLDMDGLVVPARKIFNDTCQWQYRGCGCNYGKLNGYDGPSVPVQTNRFVNLTDITDYATDLVAWFKDGATQTINGTSDLLMSDGSNIVYPKLTAWTDSSGYTVGGATTATLTGRPKVFTNTAGKTGILFGYNKDGTYDTMTFNLNFTNVGTRNINSDCTIFYVSSVKNQTGFNIINQGLMNSAGTFSLGYWSNKSKKKRNEDSFYYNNEFVNYIDQAATKVDRVYAAIIPKTAGQPASFYRDGNKITQKNVYSSALINDFGINIFNGQQSEIIVYEVIVYKKSLNDDQIKKISAYLAAKYSTPISYVITDFFYRKSLSFFTDYPQDGNLGVPMADENNKVFLKSQTLTNINYQNYELNSLVYKGDYDNTVNYVKGDFVKIDPSLNYDFNEKSILNNSEIPAKFFVCVENTVKGQHPIYNTAVWKEDKCSKDLNGCLLRFSDVSKGIPFGGFPGTVGYDYRLPS